MGFAIRSAAATFPVESDLLIKCYSDMNSIASFILEKGKINDMSGAEALGTFSYATIEPNEDDTYTYVLEVVFI